MELSPQESEIIENEYQAEKQGFGLVKARNTRKFTADGKPLSVTVLDPIYQGKNGQQYTLIFKQNTSYQINQKTGKMRNLIRI